MKTGYDELDKIFNIQMPNMIAITGSTSHFRATLSGDIANNICIYQEIKVLEVVSTFKEYLIKRIFTNFCNVNYHKWTLKNECESEKYTDLELQEIGLKTLNLIETTKKLPVIIEEEILEFDKKKILNLLKFYANTYANGIENEREALSVLDLYKFNMKLYEENNKQTMKFNKKDLKYDRYILKKAKKICKKLKCPIIFTISEDVLNQDMSQYFDYIIDLKENNKDGIFNIEVKDNSNILGKIKLKYNFEKRKFENYEKEIDYGK
jgi:hypothetical protein